jgi:C-terminal processing protease CtpA/Prc
MSACENALQAFEGHPRVMTVGENTGGAVHFGTVGDLVLHHSQIVIGIATDFWRFRDGRFVEKTGYAPRFPVQPGGDALETSLKELKVLTE